MMYKLFSVILVLSALAAGAQTHNFLSYNIRNGIGMDRVRDIGRVAEVIKTISPEIVAVQEVDSVTGRSSGTYVMGELGELTGMHPTFSPAIDYDGGRYGIGLLSRTTPLSVARYPLPGREEARTLLVAEFDDYIFACTHLSLTMEDCLASVEILRRIASQSEKPFFIAGDFNARPDSEVIRSLAKDFQILSDTTVYTFPADNPGRTLDYIMFYRRPDSKVKVESSEVVDAPMPSDHRPVNIVVSLND